MNILLIEPDKTLSQAYVQTLRQAGHTVQACREAQAAIHAADKKTPDIVLLELQLAGHSGMEFVYEFRSYAEWQQIPIVLHTFAGGETLQDVRVQFERLGIVDYLYKPATNLQQLRRAVDAAVAVGV